MGLLQQGARHVFAEAGIVTVAAGLVVESAHTMAVGSVLVLVSAWATPPS